MAVNLVSAPELPNRPTVCFADKGVTIDRDRFAEVLAVALTDALWTWRHEGIDRITAAWTAHAHPIGTPLRVSEQGIDGTFDGLAPDGALRLRREDGERSEEHTSELQSLMRISYAVFCLNKKKQ